MKSFSQFLKESSISQAVQQAQSLGLVPDGHGGWYDRRGEFIAKTVGGKLKFYNKRQKLGKDPTQTEKEKSIPSSLYNDPALSQQQAQAQPQEMPQDPQAQAQSEIPQEQSPVQYLPIPKTK
jgi:hypothetical protein